MNASSVQASVSSINTTGRAAPTVAGAEKLDPKVRAKLWNSSVDFETQYLSSMLAPMFDSVEVDETFGGGHGEEMFRSTLTNEYAKQISRGGGVGLADGVYRELLRAQEGGRHG